MENKEKAFLSKYRLELAKKSFETYKAQRKNQGETPEYERFEDQPDYLQESGLQSIDGMFEKLDYLGLSVSEKEKISEEQIVNSFSEEQIEELSKREHDRWMKERISNGWKYGEVKDIEKKLSPCLIPWEDLSEEEKDKDRRVVTNIFPLIQSCNYVVVKNKTSKKNYDVFISYRRDFGKDFADHLFEKLQDNGFSPFMDREGLRQGNYHAQLPSRIKECEKFILVLSNGALDKCKNEKDTYRKEIEEALNLKKHIIVVKLPTFSWPEKSKIPLSIQPIKDLQEIIVNKNDSFNIAFDRIIEYIKDEDWNESFYESIEEKQQNRIKKHSTKFLVLGAVIAAVIVGFIAWGIPNINNQIKASTDPSIEWGWGDNGESSRGRTSYTNAQVNDGVLGKNIVLNSISDGKIGDEKNYVGARLLTGENKGVDNTWNGNIIQVEENATYRVRLYVNNDNPSGLDAVATNVSALFQIPNEVGKEVAINGLIYSDNAQPSTYWDSVVFRSDQDFKLEYITGTALLENNGIGKGDGYNISDDVVNGKGVLLGYDNLDGRIPGGYEYAQYLTIAVKPIFK